MSSPFPQNTHVALLAVVSALLILKATKRAPEKPLLKNLRDVVSQVSADGVTGRQLFESEYDMIIVGGGEFAFVSASLGPLTLKRQNSPVGTAGCVLAARLSEDPDLRVLLLESGER